MRPPPYLHPTVVYHMRPVKSGMHLSFWKQTQSNSKSTTPLASGIMVYMFEKQIHRQFLSLITGYTLDSCQDVWRHHWFNCNCWMCWRKFKIAFLSLLIMHLFPYDCFMHTVFHVSLWILHSNWVGLQGMGESYSYSLVPCPATSSNTLHGVRSAVVAYTLSPRKGKR